MREDGGRRVTGAVEAAVRELLAVVPAGCTWLLPVTGPDGEIADFRVAATSSHGRDIYHRGVRRVDQRLSVLYPSMVGGPLWRMYLQVMSTGVAGEIPEFQYAEKRAGVVAHSLFDVSVRPVLGGLLVWWHRLDEDRRRLEKTELLGNLGWAEYDLTTGRSEWSPGLYRIFERDPALGPMSRAEQNAAMLSDDRGLGEAAWQTMDSGAASDVTVRFHAGGSVKYLRVLSDVARDATGAPLKINAVVQDVTVRQRSRTAIEQLSDKLRSRELTALAEHRLAGQLQNMIQPVPREPVLLPGLEVAVSYLPAESAVQVGGDWYHAQQLPGGKVVLAVGDVAGHGLDAASGMAHLRFALIAWLSIGIDDPALLLAHLNRLCGQLGITGTAVIGVYDPGPRTLSWARAGHPVPLLARSGRTRLLDQPAGLLLGAADDACYPVPRLRLRGGDLLLLYTDGLVERRTTSTHKLVARVKEVLSAASTQPDGEQLTLLRARLNYSSPDDDTCTLAVRVL